MYPVPFSVLFSVLFCPPPSSYRKLPSAVTGEKGDMPRKSVPCPPPLRSARPRASCPAFWDSMAAKDRVKRPQRVRGRGLGVQPRGIVAFAASGSAIRRSPFFIGWLSAAAILRPLLEREHASCRRRQTIQRPLPRLL